MKPAQKEKMAESTKYSTQQRCVNLLTLFTFQSNKVLNKRLMHSKEVSVVGEDKRGLAPCISPLSSTAQILIETVPILINHTHTHILQIATDTKCCLYCIRGKRWNAIVWVYEDFAMNRLLYVSPQFLPSA